MKHVKKSILGLGLGLAIVAGSSNIALAQTQQDSVQQQGQVQTQPQVDVQDILPQAKAQVETINNEVGLELTMEQIDGLSQAMALFMIGQYEATSDEQLQSMAAEYENQVNSILTNEQKETIANHSPEGGQ
jgi:hypothetical protein